eukprot:symbB.v1.2.034690.t2/scaffold4523.1/size38513/6
MLERHRSELKQELHQARLVMQQPPVSPRREAIPRQSARVAAAPVVTEGGCQVMLQPGRPGTLSSSASVPGLPALEQLHALADEHSAALSRLGQVSYVSLWAHFEQEISGEGVRGTPYMPPAYFTRVDTPQPYDFEENSFLKRQRKKEVKAITGTGESKITQVHVMKFQHEAVPTEPPEGAQESIREDEEPLAAALKKLFEERPLWLRGPAEERLKEQGLVANVSMMQKCFMCVAYLWSDGPFRQVYVRLGYDPRKNPESRFLQVIDFRDRLLKERRAYFEKVQGTFDQKPVEAFDPHFRTPPVNRSQLYQYIDIEDEGVQQLLQSSEVLEECCLKTGWLPQQTLDAIRERMFVKAELLRRRCSSCCFNRGGFFCQAGRARSRNHVCPFRSTSPFGPADAGPGHPVEAGTTCSCTGPGSRRGWPLGQTCLEEVNWQDVRKEIVKILDDDKYKDSSYDGATPGPLLLRLAWHSAGTFCSQTKTGGSNGATMRFEPEVSWGANAGLKLAQQMLEPVKSKFPSVSYSDLWIYAACVAIEEMGGEKVPFAPGRKDKASGAECPLWEGPTCKDGRLPSADMGSPDKTASHLRLIFNNGFTKLLDASLDKLRQQLLEAFPEETAETAVSLTSSLKSPKVEKSRSKKRDFVSEVSEITEIDEDVYVASQSPRTLQSGLKGMDAAEALQTSQRLRVRLGAISTSKLVSGQSLHDAVAALGLTRFSVQDMNDFVNTVSDFIELDFVPDGRHSRHDGSGTFEWDSHFGTPVWRWPAATSSMRKSMQNVAVTSFVPRKSYNVVPAQALMELFLAEESGIHKRLFGPRLLTQYQAMKEILLAGDTNRLVAELTFVRINDLATPPEPTHPLMYLEPFVGLLIIGNGVMIGFQTDPLFEEWPGWVWSFTAILILEIALRMHLLRCRGYWCGAEKWCLGSALCQRIGTWHVC